MKDRHHIAICPRISYHTSTITIEIHLQKYGPERMHNIINANILYQYINVVTFTYAAYLPCSHENIFVLF